MWGERGALWQGHWNRDLRENEGRGACRGRGLQARVRATVRALKWQWAQHVQEEASEVAEQCPFGSSLNAPVPPQARHRTGDMPGHSSALSMSSHLTFTTLWQGITFIPTLQMRKLKLRELKWLTQGIRTGDQYRQRAIAGCQTHALPTHTSHSTCMQAAPAQSPTTDRPPAYVTVMLLPVQAGVGEEASVPGPASFPTLHSGLHSPWTSLPSHSQHCICLRPTPGQTQTVGDALMLGNSFAKEERREGTNIYRWPVCQALKQTLCIFCFWEMMLCKNIKVGKYNIFHVDFCFPDVGSAWVISTAEGV